MEEGIGKSDTYIKCNVDIGETECNLPNDIM